GGLRSSQAASSLACAWTRPADLSDSMKRKGWWAEAGPAARAGLTARADDMGGPEDSAPRSGGPGVTPRVSTGAGRRPCTFVPLKRKADTPAVGGQELPGQGVTCDVTARPRSASGICGLGELKCSVGGICRWASARTVLISPATPAAASRWPMLLFTEPI